MTAAGSHVPPGGGATGPRGRGIGVTALRCQPGREREEMNAFPPLTKLSASAYTDFGCAACGQSLKAGERLTVIPLGPGDDVSERDRARAGRWYNAVAVIAHADCGGLPPIGPMAEDAADDEDAKGPMDHEHSDDSENQEPAA